MLLAGKIAIVTGAGQGIGQASAERLAKEGALVVATDVALAKAEAVAASIAAAGGRAEARHLDVARKADIDALVAAVVEAHGRIDVLVNNAGVVDDRPFLDLEVEEFDRVLGINLRGAFMMAQAVARQMVKQKPKGGAIVNMSSINAVFGLPDHVAYSCSKGGLAQLTKSMAIALAAEGIRVNAVGPGSIETPLLKEVVKDKAFRTKALSRTPLGRFGQASEVAAIVAWLASAEASYVTGTTIFADGGRLPLNYTVPVPD